MPVVLIIVNNGQTDRQRWRAGEAVVAKGEHEWGWMEIPKRYLNDLSVSQVNSADLSTIEPFGVVEMTDSGTITEGKDGSFEVIAGDAIVLQFNETKKYWVNFGLRPAAEYNEKRNFIWRVSDKTEAEMAAYTESFHKALTMTTVNGPDAEGRRRIEIVNAYVTASGDNTWNQSNVDDFISEWNQRYPTCGLFEYQPLTTDTVYVEGVFTQGQADEFSEVVEQYGLAELYAMRRWKINSQGMTALADNDGFLNTPSSQLVNVFEDGLLE